MVVNDGGETVGGWEVTFDVGPLTVGCELSVLSVEPIPVLSVEFVSG